MPARINQRAARDRLTSQPCPFGAGAEPSHLSCHRLAEYCNVPAAQSRNISHLSTFAVPATIDQRATRDQLTSQFCSPGAGVEISRLSCRGIAEYRNVLAAQSLNISRFVSLSSRDFCAASLGPSPRGSVLSHAPQARHNYHNDEIR